MLHEWKNWMKEIATEAILYLLEYLPYQQSRQILIPRIQQFAQAPIEEMAAWQIVLVTGLKRYYSINGQVQDSLKAKVSEFTITAQSLELLAPTLLAATNGYPKVRTAYTVVSYCYHTHLICTYPYYTRFIAYGVASCHSSSPRPHPPSSSLLRIQRASYRSGTDHPLVYMLSYSL